MKEPKKTIEEIYIRNLFSRNLKRLRDEAKMSQMGLADEAGLAHNFVNDIENGKKWFSPYTLAKLCIALKVEPHQFFVSRPKYNDKGAEMFSLYLDDLAGSFERLVEEYRDRILPEGNLRISGPGPDDIRRGLTDNSENTETGGNSEKEGKL